MPTGLRTVWYFTSDEHGEATGTMLMNWGGDVVRLTLPEEMQQRLTRLLMCEPSESGNSAHGITYIPKHHVDMELLNLATFGHPGGSPKERERVESVLAPFNVEGARKSPPNPRAPAPAQSAPVLDLNNLFGSGLSEEKVEP
jgi:hypothetical protein